MRNNSHTLIKEKFRLHIKRSFFTPIEDRAALEQGPKRLCCLQPWRFSRHDRIKPSATWSHLTTDLAVSRSLDYRPPEVSSHSERFGEILFPTVTYIVSLNISIPF